MINIELICNVTEYYILPDKQNEFNSFYLHNNCMIINFCDKNNKVLQQSEIEKEDAIKLAEHILTYYKSKL